jgi:hypothetical protein
MKRSLPWVVITIFVVYVAGAIVRPIPSAGGFDAEGFGRLPILVNGRVQPVDSAARLALLQIRGTVTVPEHGGSAWQWWKPAATLSATEWVLETLTKPSAADSRRIFRINEAAIRAVAVKAPATGRAATYYSLTDLQPRVKEIGDQVARAFKVKPADRTSTDRAWLKLRNDLVLYERLKNTLQPNSFLQGERAGKPIDYDFAAQLASYESDLVAANAARRAGKKEVFDKTTEERVVAFVRPYVGVSRAALLSLIPPSDPEHGRDRWLNAGAALTGSSRTGTYPAPLSFFARMSTAYANGKAGDFNHQLANYEKWLAARGLQTEVRRAGTEFFYNRFQPFVRAIAIYLVVLLLGGASMIRRSRMLYRCSAMLLVLAGALHAIGILFDMMLQGTLPVTNFYSGVIVAGALAVLLGAMIERVYSNGIGLGAAAVAGLGTIVAAHSVAPGGAMALASAVLDTPFWIATIVTVIALCLVPHVPGFPRWVFARQRARACNPAVDIAQRPVPTESQA